MKTLDRPRLSVDFNEMIDKHLVLLSREDQRIDSAGNEVHMRETLRVYLYMEDGDEQGNPDALLATGLVERNRSLSSWAAHVRWCCRIDRWDHLHDLDAGNAPAQ